MGSRRSKTVRNQSFQTRKTHFKGKKLEEPLKNLINTTSAMSLLYECINTLIQAKSYQPEGENSNLIQLCVDKLRILIEDNDQNLKYLGLLSMIKILGKFLTYKCSMEMFHFRHTPGGGTPA